jgi:hypothetical protein
MASFDNTLKFFLSDYPRTLFPLETSKIVITQAVDELSDYVYQSILGDGGDKFLPQTRVYAAKHGLHLRRTVKLDPVAEFYIYDLVYRNRTTFRKDFLETRKSFGYRFEHGEIISPSDSYRDFKADTSKAAKTYAYGVKFDISSYFNSIYHHDLVIWFNDGSRSEEDVLGFDSFLKQINAGRSVDCLPQGIMPCKILGNHFLKFVDDSNRIKSELLLRFMDDYCLYSNHEDTIVSDFALIQRLLGEKNLSINPSKTKIGDIEEVDVKKEIDDLKLSLLKVRRYIVRDYDKENVVEVQQRIALNQEQIGYLLNLLKSEIIEEEDAELVLTLMREHSKEVAGYIGTFLERFPNLTKNIYYFCHYVADKEGIASQIQDFLAEKGYVTEYQLFWIAKIVEDYLLKTKKAGSLLSQLYEHPNASIISQAKILEIPENRFGMKALREEHLRTGKSDWLAWAAAIGCRNEPKANRNHLLSYFANGSPINRLIAECVKRL